MRQIALFCSVLCMTACAHKSQGASSSRDVAPLTAEEASAFDDGVDFVGSLEGLEGRWREDWDRDLQIRVGSADLIALVTVRTIVTDTDPTKQVTYRLVSKVDRELVGKRAKNGELELSSVEGRLGFTSVHQNIARFTEHQFIAYVKNGPNGATWHLSPASTEIVSETDGVVSRLGRGMKQKNGERVIVRTN